MNTDRIRKYIEKVRWQKAKDGSHEYTVRVWNEELLDEFFYFVSVIRAFGYQQKYKGSTYNYFDVDGHTYWTMFHRVESTILINRKPTINT